jgi:nicotinamidase/pyrazinamidase
MATHDALIVIDLQNDFCAGGGLAVPDGDAIVPLVNQLIAQYDHVVLTQDWHPIGHQSFASAHQGRQPFESISMDYGEQTLWPDHCIQGTAGAAFHPDLNQDRAELIVRKGYRAQIDSYSAFVENDQTTSTGLAGYLRDRGFERVVMCGLATDYCVAWSALDARRLGFDCEVVLPACRAIDTNGSLAQSLEKMTNAGVILQK